MKNNWFINRGLKVLNSITKVFFVLFIIYCFLFCSHGVEHEFDKYEVIVLDSCEYIQWGASNGYLIITHKGNCKFCAEREKH